MSAKYHVNQWVIYRKSKFSGTPGPRAQDVHPTNKGDKYAYIVNKFWIVESVDESGDLILRTRRGKRHRVAPEDPGLRPANWWERWFFRNRFQAVESGVADRDATSGDDAGADRKSASDPSEKRGMDLGSTR